MSNYDIFVVDDEEANLRLLKMLLERSTGLKVGFFSDPKKALEEIKKTPKITMLVTDYDMPELNGHELAVIAKKSTDEKFTTILLSGSIESLPQKVLSFFDFCLQKMAGNKEIIAAFKKALAA